MPPTLLDELALDPRLRFRHTVHDYEGMIARGEIEEGAPFELLDGQILRKLRNGTGEDPMTIGLDHSTVVVRLGKFDRQLERLDCHLRTQQPLVLAPHDEPEPDALILAGTADDYTRRKPTASDVLCVIEVAGASLQRDRGYKQRLYAGAKIPVYVIINLADRVVEVYVNPIQEMGRYGQATTLSPQQTLALPTAVPKKPLNVRVKRLLP